MKTLLLIPVLFCALTMVSFMSPTEESVTHRASANQVAYKGKIASWSISSDGTIAVLLVGTHEKKDFSLWFVTPASQTATTRYEGLVLDAVLAFVGPFADALVTVVTDSSDQDSGKSVEDALTLSSIGHF